MRTTMTIHPPAGNRTVAENSDNTPVPGRLSAILSSPWILTFVTGGLVVTLAISAGLLEHAHYNDENFYNRLIRYYGGQSLFTPLHDSANHPISIGPSFFLAHRLFSGIAGSGDFQARTLSLIFMLAASAFWTSIALRLDREMTPALILAFWIMPFHAVFASCALSESFMLVLMLASIRLWIAAADHKDDSRIACLLACFSGILLGLALNSKTPLLAPTVALLLIGAFRMRNPWSVLAPLIAILMQIPFWVAWGNVFPPGQRQGMMPQFAHMNGLFPDTVIHILTVSGTVLWPAFRFDRRSRTDWFLILTGVALWIAFGPRIDPSEETRYRFAGPVLQASYLGPFVRWFLIVPFLAGWQVFCMSIRHLIRNDIDINRQAFMAAAVVSVVAFVRSPLAFDRYVVCFLPLWWMAFWPELRRYPLLTAISFVPLTIEAVILLDKIMSMELMFGSPLPHLAGF